MLFELHLCVILAAFSTVLAEEDIKVTCLEDSVRIAWRIRAELVDYAGRFFLGNCKKSDIETLDSGEVELKFDYKFSQCKFTQQLKGKHNLFKNKLFFRPHHKGHPPAFVHPITCVAKRPDVKVPSYLNPGAGTSQAHGGLVFHMALLNAEMSDVSQNNVIPLGSPMPIWATVDQKAHQPLLLLMEDCFAATTPQLSAESPVHTLITNKGCLVESKRGNAGFVTRQHSSSLILYVQSLPFGLGQEMYIHCKLVAWDPERIDKTKKACYYSKLNQRWELLDRPEKSSICSCCDSNCKGKSRRRADDTESEGLSSIFVLGPILTVDRSDPRAQDTLSGSTSAVVNK